MNKTEIVEELYKTKVLRKLITNIFKNNFNKEVDDFEHDIVVILLSMEDRKLIELYNAETLKFYIIRIIINNLSKKGKFIKNYITFQNITENIDDYDYDKKQWN